MTNATRRLSCATFLAGSMMLAGCGALTPSGDDTNLIPPSAVYQPGASAPMYPPVGFNNPNLNAGNIAPSRRTSDDVLPDDTRFDAPSNSVLVNPNRGSDSIVPNSPMLTPSNVIELTAVGMGVAPESTISPSQALALAKRAAIVDAYRQLGEKMYGIRVNAQDTVRDMVLQNSTVKTKVQALIRNAEITETVYKDGLCQVSMELKLDGKVWYQVLSGGRA